MQLDTIQRQEALRQRKLYLNQGDDTVQPDIKQFSRITVTVDEMADASSISVGNEALRAFDIVAICPGNGKIFSYACQTAEVDIISLDFTHRLPFSINKKVLDIAVARGIYFEIKYSPIVGCEFSFDMNNSFERIISKICIFIW